ncbi:MAG: class I SAM-dependent methyltransferase [Alphaproteobacteria bacterium]
MAREAGDEAVRAQYDAYPYPERDPADETRRLVVGSPSHLAEVNHYVFAGRLDLARPLRVLVAGGGTGDAAIMLAQQLAWAHSPAEVVYLDVSRAARKLAEARAAARGLANIRFVEGSLLDLAALAAGPYDYIDCCGVLHHLADPGAGLATLADALADDGGIGLMLYGAFGRTGVYHAQAMLRLIAGADARENLALARRLCAELPESNWLRRNPFVADHIEGGDAGLYDLLLHTRDRAYTVPELAALVAGAGLAVTGFIEPALYDPANQLSDPELKARVTALPWLERCAFAELLAGSLKRHVFYAVKTARAEEAVARPDGPKAVPVLREADGPAMARKLKRGGRIRAELEGIKLAYDLPPLAGAILALVDGRRSLGDIHREIARHRPGARDWLAFKAAFDKLYAALNAINVMLIAQPARRA